MCSNNDKAVLNAIFNPELPGFQEEPSKEEEIDGNDFFFQHFNHMKNNVQLIFFHYIELPATKEETEAAKLEISGIEEAEKGNLMKAIEIFDSAIKLAPKRAAGYNNRAQALQLKGDVSSKC